LQKYTDDWLPDFYPRPIEDVNQVGFNGDRPIHIACIRGSLDHVLALIEGGADINAAGDLGYTALHLAAKDRHLDILKLLLRRGADVNAKNEFGQTALDVAKICEQSRAVEVLELKARS
jgi:uncharacterized protein